MTLKIRWKGESPVVFYEGDTRIELQKGEEVTVEFMPMGGNFEVIDGVLVEFEQVDKDKVKLRETLELGGLSPNRVEKVCSRFNSMKELESQLDKLPFEKITSDWLKEKFSEKVVEKKVTKKKTKENKEEIK